MDTLKITEGPCPVPFRGTGGSEVNVTPHMFAALQRIRPALIATAQARSITTYGLLSDATGAPYTAQGWGPALDVLSVDCAERGEPSLASLVVRKREGEVGSAFVGDAAAERMRCWAFWAAR